MCLSHMLLQNVVAMNAVSSSHVSRPETLSANGSDISFQCNYFPLSLCQHPAISAYRPIYIVLRQNATIAALPVSAASVAHVNLFKDVTVHEMIQDNKNCDWSTGRFVFLSLVSRLIMKTAVSQLSWDELRKFLNCNVFCVAPCTLYPQLIKTARWQYKHGGKCPQRCLDTRECVWQWIRCMSEHVSKIIFILSVLFC